MVHMFKPDWALPENVGVAVTTRLGGKSSGPFSSNNLGKHVGDDVKAVSENRNQLEHSIGTPIQWLNQVHSTDVVEVNSIETNLTADGLATQSKGIALAVMTADCLPILLCDDSGDQIAALHAGWRGLANGIIEKGLSRFKDSSKVKVFLGPAIGPKRFEVGEEVFDQFVGGNPEAEQAFQSNREGHYLADLYLLAKLQLNQLGCSQIAGGTECTYEQSDKYFSYRREGTTGRMASVIWLKG